MNISTLNQRRLKNFNSNKRGYYSFWIFIILFLISIFANFIANDKPLMLKYNSNYYFPIIKQYAETVFGGDFEAFFDEQKLRSGSRTLYNRSRKNQKHDKKYEKKMSFKLKF